MAGEAATKLFCPNKHGLKTSLVRLSVEDLWDFGQLKLAKYKLGHYVILPQYAMDVRGYHPYKEEIKNLIPIKTEAIAQAKKILAGKQSKFMSDHPIYPMILILDFKKTLCKYDVCVMVAIHVRARDYAYHLKVRYNYTEILADDSTYLERTMNYLNGQDTVFYVISEESHRVKEFMIEKNLLSKYSIAWPPKKDKAVDFALISLADKVILSYGSYGFMASAIYGRADEILSPNGYEDTFENKCISLAEPPVVTYV